eukprot:scaffold20962_cov112-Isochrysis_galbana.AAC.8
MSGTCVRRETMHTSLLSDLAHDPGAIYKTIASCARRGGLSRRYVLLRIVRFVARLALAAHGAALAARGAALTNLGTVRTCILRVPSGRAWIIRARTEGYCVRDALRLIFKPLIGPPFVTWKYDNVDIVDVLSDPIRPAVHSLNIGAAVSALRSRT